MLRRCLRWAAVPALLSLAFAATAQGRTELLVFDPVTARDIRHNRKEHARRFFVLQSLGRIHRIHDGRW